VTQYCMITQAYPPSVGGVERHVASVHHALREAGHDGTVLVISPTPFAVTDPSVRWVPGGRVARVPLTSRARVTAGLLPQLPAGREAVIHVHDLNALSVAFPALLLRRALRRTFLTIHGWDGIYPPSSRMQSRLHHAVRSVRGTLCVGAFVRKWYGLGEGPVTYGGVDDFRCPPPADVLSRPLEVAYVGRLEPDTGVLELVRGFLDVWRAEPDSLRLIVRGAGSLRPEIEALARRAQGAIVFREPTSTLEELYGAPVVFASGYLTIAEALRARRIVFAFFGNPIRRDYLVLHPAAAALRICGSEDDVARELLQCLASGSEMLAAAAEGWAWAEGQSWAAVARQYVDLWTAK
jgi:glycosyltransferase involved in cell wall biosynthesis